MPDHWKVVIIDLVSAPGLERRQDVTDYVDMMQSNFHPTISDKVGQSTAFLSFRIDTPDLFIRERMEVWAGFCDDAGTWTVPWFGGYIEELSSTTNGFEHKLELTLVDYGILLSDTEVLRWPRDITDPIIDGYPEGYSVAQWLVGGGSVPFDGVIPSFLTGISWDIDAVFGSVMLINDLPGVINASALPGDSTIYGEWQFTCLRKIVEDLADITHIIDATIQPAFWMRAVASGSDIIPQFVVRNIAEVSPTVAAVFSFEPGPGEYLMEHPFTHKRNASLVRTRVTVKGVGSDMTGIAPNIDPIRYAATAPLNWWTEYREEHAAAYPTKYQINPGWSGTPIQDERINTLGKSRSIAEHIEQQVWGARGSVEFRTDQFILPGEFVQIKDPVEFGDSDPIYPVNEVVFETNPGRPLYTIHCGHTPIEIGDILKGGTTDIPILANDTGRAAAASAGHTNLISGSFSPAGQPKGSVVPLVQIPTNSQQNILRPHMTGQSALHIIQSAQLDPNEDPGNPNRLPLFTVRADTLTTSLGGDAQGHPHPVRISMSFSKDGFRIWHNYYPCTFVDETRTDSVFNLGVTVTYRLNGVLMGTPSLLLPLVYPGGDAKLRIDVVGVDPTVGMGLYISEYGKPAVGGVGWSG